MKFLFNWSSNILKGGLFTATMSFPDDFPNMPPVLQFKTKFFHPNS